MVLRIVLLTTLLTVSIGSATQPALDADTLQQALAKIVFAHQVSVISDSMWGKYGKELTTHNSFVADLNKKSLQLQASNIVSGPIHDIANRPLIELVSSPSGNQFLDVGDATSHISDAAKKVDVNERMAPVLWNNNGGLTEFRLPATLNDYIKAESRYACTNYVSATIAATYEGQSASWRALYLTGCPNNTVQAIDLGMRDAVPDFLNADVYPYVLQRSYQARNPLVQKWLRDNASPACLKKLAVCLESGRVVIPQQDTIEPMLSAPPSKSTPSAAFTPQVRSRTRPTENLIEASR